MKTSILILDKSIAKKSDTIAFFKVENDGFGLGAQRRAFDKNDLPQVQAELAAYLQALRAKAPTESSLALTSTAQIVLKEKIAANGDYNLSGERYREGVAKTNIFPLVKLSEVCTVNPRKSQLAEKLDIRVSFVPMADINEHRISFQPSDEKQLSEVSASYTYFEDNDVLLAKVTPCFENGKAGIARGLLNGIGFGSSEFYVLRSKGQVMPEWVYFCVMHPLFREAAVAQMTGTGGLQRVPRDYVENFKIPLPPLEVQKEIVAEIEGYQKVINGARAVLDNYRPHIPIHPEWPLVELAEITKPEYGFTEKAAEQGDARFVRITDISEDGRLRTEAPKFITLTKEAQDSLLSNGDILVARTGATFGKTMIFEQDYPAVFASFLIRLRFPKDRVQPRYYWVFAQSDLYWNQANALMTGGGQPQFNGNALVQVKIPLPPLATQQAIVAEIEAEQALVAANRELITRFEKKIQTTLARIWGEEVPTAD